METILECTENMEETREAEETREKIDICIFCGEAIYEGDEYKDDHGTFICQECFEEKYFICDCCGEIHPNDAQVWVHDSIYLHSFCSRYTPSSAIKLHPPSSVLRNDFQN